MGANVHSRVSQAKHLNDVRMYDSLTSLLLYLKTILVDTAVDIVTFYCLLLFLIIFSFQLACSYLLFNFCMYWIPSYFVLVLFKSFWGVILSYYCPSEFVLI